MSTLPTNKKEVDAVFVMDNPYLLEAFKLCASLHHKKVNTYLDPQHFLDNIYYYPKQSKIILDQRFGQLAQKGIEMAQYLHILGFTHLYLHASSQRFPPHPLPRYVTAIEKLDINRIKHTVMGIVES